MSVIASSPDSPFLYRELGGVERKKGSSDLALEHFRKAVALEPVDAASHAQIGELLEERGEIDGAVKAFSQSLAIEPNSAVQARLDAVRARSAFALLPAEYRALDQAPQLTRGDLAALVGIRLGKLLQNGQRPAPAVITDVRNHWAAPWIMAVTRAGVMDAFANHAFQPRGVVRRIDLAQAVARLQFTDLSARHVAYPAASAAVASGILATGPNNTFQPSKPVTGAEAIEAIGKLEALTGRP